MNLPDYRRKVVIPVVNTGMGGGAFQLVCYGLYAEMLHTEETRRTVGKRLSGRGFGPEWKPVWDAIHVEKSDYSKLGWLGKKSQRYHS